MQTPRVIPWLTYSMLAVLLLVTAVWSWLDNGLVQRQVVQFKNTTAVIQDANVSQTHDALSDYGQLTATPAQAVVVPAPKVGNGNPVTFRLPASIFLMVLLWSIPLLRHFGFLHYFFAYFRHLFGHSIVPNAP